MSRRKPGQSAIVTQRKEPDDVQFFRVFLKEKQPVLQSVFIPNTNQKSDDYSHIKDNYRPSHADYVYEKNTEPAIIAVVDVVLRETASRVVAGAKQMLQILKLMPMFLL
jgi:chorismate synthase